MEQVTELLSREYWQRAVAFHGHECPGLAIGFKAVEGVIAEFGLDASQLPAIDEELVCITENDACCVDAIQSLLGCTFGKANLIPRLRGKMAFSFYVRDADSAQGTANATQGAANAAKAATTRENAAANVVNEANAVNAANAMNASAGSEPGAAATPATSATTTTPAATKAVRLYLKPDAGAGMSRDEFQEYLLTKPYTELFEVKAPNWDLPEPARHFDSHLCSVCGESTAEYALRLHEGKPVCVDCYDAYDREGF